MLLSVSYNIPDHACRGAAAAVVVFDITNADSFAKAKAWVKELQRMGNPNMIMALAGNKADLAEARAVTAEEAQVCSFGFPGPGPARS